MSTEHNKAVVRRWLLEGFNNGDMTAVEECLTEDYVNHGTNGVREDTRPGGRSSPRRAPLAPMPGSPSSTWSPRTIS